MANSEKPLKRGKDGSITRYVGKNQSGYSEKFCLGYDLSLAKCHLRLIDLLWNELRSRNVDYWTPEYLKSAKAIAKGKKALFPPRPLGEAPEWYLKRLAKINFASNGAFQPSDESDFREGILETRSIVQSATIALSNGGQGVNTGQTLADAIKGFK